MGGDTFLDGGSDARRVRYTQGWILCACNFDFLQSDEVYLNLHEDERIEESCCDGMTVCSLKE